MSLKLLLISALFELLKLPSQPSSVDVVYTGDESENSTSKKNSVQHHRTASVHSDH